MKTAKELAQELRPTMPEEVLRAWALDAKAVLERVAEAAPTEANRGALAEKIKNAREDADGWEAAAPPSGREHFAYVGVARTLRDLATTLEDIVLSEAKYGECAVCHQPYERFDSPSGVFYSHFKHPDDGHDAVPVPVPKTQDGEAREALQDVIAPLVASYVSGPLDPLDVEIADAILARYTLVPVSPKGGE